MRACVGWCLVVLLAVASFASRSWAYDRDGLRGYLGLRVGGLPLFTDTESDSEIHLEDKSEALAGAVLGFNWSRHWGFELAGERSKQGLVLASTGGRTAFYPWWTVLGQFRWRYPVLNDRLTPYLIAGGGFRFTEVEQKDSDSPVFFGNDQQPVGTVGGGLEYFIMNNVTLGLELKYIFGADSEIGTLTGTHKLDMDVLVYTFGLRVFYPEQ